MPGSSGFIARAAFLAMAGSSAAAQPAPSAPAPAPAPEAPDAQPARWHLDGSTSRCVLTRRLAGTPVPATFVLRTIPGSGRYDLILASPDMPPEIRRLRTQPRLTLALTPADVTVETRAAPIELPASLGEGFAIGPLPAAFLPVFGDTAVLALADGDGRRLGSWAVPAAARAAEAVSYCEAEKLVEWGADPAGFEPGATRPQPAATASDWLNPRDLGLTGVFASYAYTAIYRLVLDTDGRVTDCALLESAGNVDLGRGCAVLRRVARYTPARDAAGNPIRSVAVHVVSVRMDVEIRIIQG
jgi:hypothetical protein